MAFSYSGDPASSSLDLVRFLIGDTVEQGALYSDAEINAILDTSASPNWAAVRLVESAIARYATKLDKSIDGLSVKYSQVVLNLEKLRDSLSRAAGSESLGRLGAGMYAGGISREEGRRDHLDNTMRQPKFRKGQFRNRENPN